jgi:ligand-binding sensor domain-containing protein
MTPREGLAGWEVMAILEDSDGVLWLGSDNGVSRVESVDLVF